MPVPSFSGAVESESVMVTGLFWWSCRAGGCAEAAFQNTRSGCNLAPHGSRGFAGGTISGVLVSFEDGLELVGALLTNEGVGVVVVIVVVEPDGLAERVHSCFDWFEVPERSARGVERRPLVGVSVNDLTQFAPRRRPGRHGCAVEL